MPVKCSLVWPAWPPWICVFAIVLRVQFYITVPPCHEGFCFLTHSDSEFSFNSRIPSPTNFWLLNNHLLELYPDVWGRVSPTKSRSLVDKAKSVSFQNYHRHFDNTVFSLEGLRHGTGRDAKAVWIAQNRGSALELGTRSCSSSSLHLLSAKNPSRWTRKGKHFACTHALGFLSLWYQLKRGVCLAIFASQYRQVLLAEAARSTSWTPNFNEK